MFLGHWRGSDEAWESDGYSHDDGDEKLHCASGYVFLLTWSEINLFAGQLSLTEPEVVW
jgi:hypothetical protein